MSLEGQPSKLRKNGNHHQTQRDPLHLHVNFRFNRINFDFQHFPSLPTRSKVSNYVRMTELWRSLKFRHFRPTGSGRNWSKHVCVHVYIQKYEDTYIVVTLYGSPIKLRKNGLHHRNQRERLYLHVIFHVNRVNFHFSLFCALRKKSQKWRFWRRLEKIFKLSAPAAFLCLLEI